MVQSEPVFALDHSKSRKFIPLLPNLPPGHKLSTLLTHLDQGHKKLFDFVELDLGLFLGLCTDRGRCVLILSFVLKQLNLVRMTNSHVWIHQNKILARLCLTFSIGVILVKNFNTLPVSEALLQT